MAKAKSSLDQLSLFDTTALTSFSLDGGGFGTLLPPLDAAEEEPPGAPLAPAVPRVVAHDFRLAGDRGLASSWKARAAGNLAAIQLMQRIEAETRPATAEEQAVLARFVGYGASDLANALFRRPGEAWREGWAEQGDGLEQAVSATELASLARCTQYAHFTPEYVVRAVWAGLTRLGFRQGTVLEPGCGTGLFLALRPEGMTDCSTVTGVEMDPVTARIAALLYPKAWIRQEDFTRARIPETFDLALGNPPFSDRTVRAGDPAGKLGLKLHDYFIARAVERLKPGGLAAFVTSHGTLDKVDPKAREHIAEMADLVGAIRLPAGSFAAAAGTDVVVDILFLQRRERAAAPNGVAWAHLAEVVPAEDSEAAIHVNAWFAAHPEMVLGRHGWTSGPFGLAYDCTRDGRDLEAALAEAVARLPQGIHQPPAEAAAARPAKAAPRVGTAAEGATIKEGSYLIGEGGVLLQVVDGSPEPVAVKSGKGTVGLFAKHARIIRGLIPVREAAREVIRAQEADQPFGAAQVRLRTAYGSFLRAFGPINLTNISTSTDEETGEVRETVRRPNLQPFLDDPDCWLVSSIEEYDPETGTARKGPIFTERVIHAPAEPVIVTAADALAVTLAERGVVDLAHACDLLGRDRDTVLAELGDTVFLDPGLTTEGFEAWQTADEYLSGQVRRKLAAARAAAALDARYARNVTALERVQPEDLRPSDITARLGAPWIPAGDVEAFIREVIGVETPVRHTVEVAHWSIDVRRFVGLASATSEWGTHRRHAGELLDDALNASIPQIWDVWRDEQGEHRQLNAQETEAAKDKLAKIKDAFERWVWTDSERAERLVRLYNDAFNSLVPRHFSGEHLQLPGASSVIQLRAHQKRVVWRIVSSGQTYVAHAVGAGKTFTIAAAIMEQKRLGLISNPGGRRNQLFQGQAGALPGPGGDGQLGLHHHHPLGLQVHRRPGRVRARPHAGPARRLCGPAGEARRRRPHRAQAHRAHEGGDAGEARSARLGQGRHADHRRDGRRPSDRRRGAGVPQALLRHQHGRPQGHRPGRLAARLGSVREVALHRHHQPWPRPDPGVGHADHQHAGRDVHAAAPHAAGDAGRSRHPGVRRLGRQLRGHPHRAGAAALRPLQTGDAFLGVRQRRRPDRHVPHRRGRGAEGRPAPVPEAARHRGRQASDHHRPGEPGLQGLPAHPGGADQGHRGAQGQAREGTGHPALGHHRRPPCRHRPPFRGGGGGR
ncbi:MAG: N-6 DNA methylase [Acetobacteraceae bacterium]|nr:N-6 DNA methylase [Acetobacteraceae bacterium]